jgi:signal transduction histidine kinase
MMTESAPQDTSGGSDTMHAELTESPEGLLAPGRRVAGTARRRIAFPRGLSLRAKGGLLFAVMIVYMAATGVMLSRDRHTLLDMVDELEYVQRFESRLTQANLMLARTIVLVNDNFAAQDVAVTSPTVVVELEAVRTAVQRLENRFPRLIFLSHSLGPLAEQLDAAPSRGLLGVIRGTLHAMVTELDQITEEEQKHRSELLAAYRATNDALIQRGIFFSLLGVIGFGLIIAIFLTRLTLDIGDLKTRAFAIVKGYRGMPLKVSRRDELGSLMESVNTIQDELRWRESQMELERQQRFHREKMAAVGSLAAAVAHEINNPITAIAGVAEAIQERCEGAECVNLGHHCKPGLILEQARRVSQITRQLAEVSAPRPLEAELTDINGLVRSTCSFIAFDRRFRGVDLSTQLDGDLPAVTLVADHLTQVLMNLLINAADAVEGKSERRVRVETGRRGHEVSIRVVDNGTGMDAEVLARAFEEFYTTKPSGKGTGLGLPVCKSLVEASGGRIELLTKPGEGTTATVWLPLEPVQQPGEERHARTDHR